MSQIKKKHIRSKTIWQIFMMFLEIAVIVGGLTLGSSLLWEFESGLDILERVGLFYGFYQILTYIILSNLNDIKADEFLALKNTASIALKACEYNDEVWKGITKDQIDKQLDNGVFNDMLPLHILASSVNLYRFTIFANPLVGATSPIPFEHHLSMMAARSF